jgi:hypothetical protein
VCTHAAVVSPAFGWRLGTLHVATAPSAHMLLGGPQPLVQAYPPDPHAVAAVPSLAPASARASVGEAPSSATYWRMRVVCYIL